MSKRIYQISASAFISFCALMPYSAYAYEDPRACCHGNGPPAWYFGLAGSAVYLERTEIEVSNTASYLPANQSYNRGYAMSAQVGYKVFSGIRAELEISQRENRVKKDLFVNGSIPQGSYTAQTSTAVMANAYMDLRNETNFFPYIGAGIGAAFVKNPDFYVDGATQRSTGKIMGWTMAYQFMTGIAYDFPNRFAPVEFFAGYKYFNAPNTENDYKGPNSSTFKVNNTTHSFEVGGRVYFN